jgi:hypothetical protein
VKLGIRIKCTALLALCFWSMQVYEVPSGLSPDASLGMSLSEGQNSRMGIKSRQTPKVRKTRLPRECHLCIHLPFSISHRKVGECLDFLDIKALSRHSLSCSRCDRKEHRRSVRFAGYAQSAAKDAIAAFQKTRAADGKYRRAQASCVRSGF